MLPSILLERRRRSGASRGVLLCCYNASDVRSTLQMYHPLKIYKYEAKHTSCVTRSYLRRMKWISGSITTTNQSALLDADENPLTCHQEFNMLSSAHHPFIHSSSCTLGQCSPRACKGFNLLTLKKGGSQRIVENESAHVRCQIYVLGSQTPLHLFLAIVKFIFHILLNMI